MVNYTYYQIQDEVNIDWRNGSLSENYSDNYNPFKRFISQNIEEQNTSLLGRSYSVVLPRIINL